MTGITKELAEHFALNFSREAFREIAENADKYCQALRKEANETWPHLVGAFANAEQEALFRMYQDDQDAFAMLANSLDRVVKIMDRVKQEGN